VPGGPVYLSGSCPNRSQPSETVRSLPAGCTLECMKRAAERQGGIFRSERRSVLRKRPRLNVAARPQDGFARVREPFSKCPTIICRRVPWSFHVRAGRSGELVGLMRRGTADIQKDKLDCEEGTGADRKRGADRTDGARKDGKRQKGEADGEGWEEKGGEKIQKRGQKTSPPPPNTCAWTSPTTMESTTGRLQAAPRNLAQSGVLKWRR